MKKRIILCVLLLLVSCQPQNTNESSHITEEEIVSALMKNEVNLEKAQISKENIFGSKLNMVKPAVYKINDKELYIFEFNTEEALRKGLKEFDDQTATISLVSHSVFKKWNLLIFYVHEQDLSSKNIPFEKEIQDTLDRMIDG